MSLDIKTIIFLTAVSAIVMCIAMFVTSTNYPQIKGIRKWAWACGAQGTGWGLMSFRGSIHDFFSIVIANTLIVGSAALFYMAITTFKERESRGVVFYPFLILLLLAISFFTFVQPSFEIRSIIMASAGAAIILFCAYQILVNPRRRPTMSEWVMGTGFISIAIAAFARIFDMIFHQHDSRLFVESGIHTFVFCLIFISIFILTFSFALMINDKFMSEILKLATLDPLTEVYNRGAMESVISKEIERSKRYDLEMSLLLLDLDHFKKVNDSFGHQVGDYVLKSLVKSISKELREHDILGRYGGEEFTILLPDTDLKNSQIVAERVRQTVEKTRIRIESNKISITISIGLATLKKPSDGFPDIFRRADLGLYKAKQTGRNRVAAIRDEDLTSGGLREIDDSIFKSNPHLEIPTQIGEEMRDSGGRTT